jgi:hypothetical protein
MLSTPTDRQRKNHDITCRHVPELAANRLSSSGSLSVDADQFDGLTRGLSVAASRRVNRRLAVLPAIGALVGLVFVRDEVEAEHPVRRVQGRRDRRRQRERNDNDHHHKHHHKRAPGSSSRDCADGSVQCCSPRFVADIGSVCGQEYGRFGPVGFCFLPTFKCRPCGTQYDAEWSDKCNANFGSCGGVGCQAFYVH